MNTRRVAKTFNGLFAVNKPCGILSTHVVYVKISYLKKTKSKHKKKINFIALTPFTCYCLNL